jgi:type II secretory pathway pseudopilin PulG
MKTKFPRAAQSAMTLVELLVIIVVVVIAAVLIGFTYGPFQKSSGIRPLSNAKQIVLALRLYASDNDDKFPSFTLDGDKPTTTPVTTSNDAFCQLFPNYISQEAIFWLHGSAWCIPNPPPETYDDPTRSPSRLTLASGQNEYAYVLALKDNSDPGFPLIADGFANPVAHTYAGDPSEKGGVW